MEQAQSNIHYELHLLHLTKSFLLSSEDIRHFLLSRWRQLMATLLVIPIFLPTHLIMGIDHIKFNLVWQFVLHLIFCFCQGLKMMGSDKIHTASCTYVHFLSLCHLYPWLVTWRIQMRTFKRYLSHAIILTTLHLKEMN
jgi:hypothetical protein